MTATLNPLACPTVDSNHAPSGSEPDVLSAELAGLVKLVDAVGLEPTMPKAPALQAGRNTRC